MEAMTFIFDISVSCVAQEEEVQSFHLLNRPREVTYVDSQSPGEEAQPQSSYVDS
jgi:hypothetical protein